MEKLVLESVGGRGMVNFTGDNCGFKRKVDGSSGGYEQSILHAALTVKMDDAKALGLDKCSAWVAPNRDEVLKDENFSMGVLQAAKDGLAARIRTWWKNALVLNRVLDADHDGGSSIAYADGEAPSVCVEPNGDIKVIPKSVGKGGDRSEGHINQLQANNATVLEALLLDLSLESSLDTLTKLWGSIDAKVKELQDRVLKDFVAGKGEIRRLRDVCLIQCSPTASLLSNSPP